MREQTLYRRGEIDFIAHYYFRVPTKPMKAPSSKVRADVSAHDGVSCSCYVDTHRSFNLRFPATKESPHMNFFSWSFGKQTPMALSFGSFFWRISRRLGTKEGRGNKGRFYISIPFPRSGILTVKVYIHIAKDGQPS
jgi:hypothetical protein